MNDFARPLRVGHLDNGNYDVELDIGVADVAHLTVPVDADPTATAAFVRDLAASRYARETPQPQSEESTP